MLTKCPQCGCLHKATTEDANSPRIVADGQNSRKIIGQIKQIETARDNAREEANRYEAVLRRTLGNFECKDESGELYDCWDIGCIVTDSFDEACELLASLVSDMTTENDSMREALQKIGAWEFDFTGDCVADARRFAKKALAGGEG